MRRPPVDRRWRLWSPAGALLLVALTSSLYGFRSAPTERMRPAPKLVVLLVVDQMRADAINRYQHQWTAGLRRLVDQGALFRRAKYTYFGTLTCAGHATIATGSVPATHGIVLDGWWDKTAGRRVRCTADPRVEVVRYGEGGREQHGPSTLKVPTLADELRVQRDPAARVAAFSIKSRSAVVMAGQQADAVAWFDAGNAWTTSTAFTPHPVPFVQQFVRANPVERDLGRVWTPTLAPDRYRDATNGSGDPAPFAYRMVGESDTPDTPFYTEWKRSPFADEYLGRMATAAVDALDLGGGEGTDVLAIGFSASDYVGHDFGPRSPELQDLYVRLDATIGDLLDHLDRRVGHDQYVVALSADHGLGPIPERIAELGFDAGRMGRRDVVAAVNQALEPILGPGEYAAGMTHIEFYFAPGVYERLLQHPIAMDAAIDALQAVPGVARVYRGEALLAGPFADPLTRLVARSYYPGRSGDLVVIPKPFWYTWIRAADHGTGYDYDTRVPLILFGAGISPGDYWGDAAPEDIAPTLAFLGGVTLAQADGRVLWEAIEP